MPKAGFAVRDITPVLGSEMPGMLNKRFGESVHDPLLVSAMVAEGDGKPVAIVGVDALSLKRSMVVAARTRVAAQTGLDAEAVMVAASHTHNGGATADAFLSESDPDYCRRVSDAIADAVIEAWMRREDAVFKEGSGHQAGIAFNRRFRMKTGGELTHPGKGNPGILEPAGAVDPEVGVIGAFSRTDGRFLGCMVNYTCHCTVGVGGAGFSADYPLYLRRAVNAVMQSPDSVVVFTNGACGDVTQVDNLRVGTRESGEQWGRYLGHCVAGEVIKVLSNVELDADIQTGRVTKVLRIEHRDLPTETVTEARRLLKKRDREASAWDRDSILAREMVLLADMIDTEPEVEAEIQALRLGSACVVSSPAEYFCQFGLDIKARTQSPYTFVVELANGCIGYVPNAEQVIKSEGYEPRLARSSKLCPEAGDRIAEASIQLVNRLVGTLSG